MAVLYRTYRPQKFGDVVGQEYIVKALQSAAKTGDFAHAYLFCGSRGVGKTSLARILAKAANCENLKDGEVCLTCQSCVAVSQGAFLDLIEIDAASNTGVDNVRELIEHVRFQPSSGKFKVFIIDEVHMLSKGAFNALLKTLEEPPSHAIFILATTEIHKVPATIISRTQRFTFGRVSLRDTAKQLQSVAKQEKLQIADDALELIARYSEGSLRDALSILGKVATLGGKISLSDIEQMLGVTTFASSFELMELIGQKKTASLPEFFENLLEQGTDFTIFNKDFLEHLRLLLIYSASSVVATDALTEDQKQQVIGQSAYMATPEWMRLIRLFLRSLKDAAIAPMPELPMLLASLEAASDPVARVSSQAVVQKQVEPNKQVKSSPPEITTQNLSETVSAPKQINEEIITRAPDEVSEAEVLAFWPKVIDAVRLKNSPLATLLRNSPFDNAQNGIITLRVKYLFHKEHLENLKNQGLITEVALGVTGKNIRVKAVVSKPEGEKKDVVDLVSDALQVFGGELVE